MLTLRALRNDGCIGRNDTQFIDQSDICAVVLNEAITFNDVVYYLAFMVEGQTDMVLAYEVRTTRSHLFTHVHTRQSN